ncbi:MAG TPA: hypothetical protein VGD69_23750 [Herpetosiphonaceae bacterium]
MSQLPFDRLMRELASYLGTPLDFDRGIYRLIVPLPMGRQQEVSASIRDDGDGRPIIAFVSTVGEARRGIEPWSLLRANGSPIYSRVALMGNMIAVIASQLLNTAQPEEVLLILREVAQFADQLERQHFRGDLF